MECAPITDNSKTFTVNYLSKVRRRLTLQRDKYESFLHALSEFNEQTDGIHDLYNTLKSIFGPDNIDLSQEFIALLTPPQAASANQLVTLLLFKLWANFFTQLSIIYANKPSAIQKILQKLKQLSREDLITITKLKSDMLPLFKGNKSLLDSFLQIFPMAKPPESLLSSHFDSVDLTKTDMDASYETIIIPEDVEPSAFGTNSCPCVCHHVVSKASSRSPHCVRCGVNFLHNRIFIQTRNRLKRAKVTFLNSEMPLDAHIKRLSPHSNVLSTECQRASLECDAEDESSSTWSKSEDKIILATCQRVENLNHALEEVHQILPRRSKDAINDRFHTLLQILSQVSSKPSK